MFVWLNDTLRPIQKSDLFQLDDADYCKQINPAHTDVIMEAGVHQLQSTRDKLHVLDEHGIRKLLNEEQDEIPRALYVSDLLSMDEEKKRAVLAAQKFDITNILPLYEAVYEKAFASRKTMSL